jgi:hypothetical protein
LATLTITSTVSGPATVPTQLQDDWFNGLSAAAASKISQRWHAIVGTSTLWTNNVANPSNANFKPMISDTFTSKRERTKSMIVGLQLKKLNASFATALIDFDDQFANSAAKYLTAVTNKAGRFTAGFGNTLAVTGDRFQGKRGPASVHVRAIAGDQTFQRDLGGSTTVTGDYDPLAITPTPEAPYVIAGMRSMVRAALEGKIIQVGTLLLETVITPDDLTALNTILTTVLTNFLRPGYQGGSSMTFAAVSGGFTLTTLLTGTQAP